MSLRSVALRDLLVAAPDAQVSGDAAQQISGIVYDSRLVQPGDLFAALRGADLDGHAFVSSAQARGAAALLVEEECDSPLPQIVVGDSRASLAALSNAFFGRPSHELGVIGITGTDGKTTTSYIVDHLLRTSGARTGLVGTVAIRIGDEEDLHASRQTTPESNDIQRYLRTMVDAGVTWAILEATSHGLAMHRLDHVRFQIGAVTNITHEHLDYHGSLESYRRAKAMLLERVAATGGTVVMNADDAGSRAIEPYAKGASLLRYAISDQSADVRARNVAMTGSGSTFTLDAAGYGSADVDLPLIGEFNIANALCAASVALAAGLDLEAIAAGLATAPPVPGRMRRIAAGQPFSVVVDYAHTPESLEKVLNLLRGLHPSGRLITVFGSAGERDVAKRPVQGAVAARLADVVVVTSEDPRNEDADAIIAQIVVGAQQAGGLLDRTLFARTDRREAIALALSLAQPGDCILLAGKGHEGSIIWGSRKVPWDEARVTQELLAEAGFAGSPAP